MSAETLLQRSNAHFTSNAQWNHAEAIVSRVAIAREAIRAVAPYGDHLLQWLIGEVSDHPMADREWIAGVLKETIAEQRPDIPMTWLDFRLPTKYYGQCDGHEERTTAT